MQTSSWTQFAHSTPIAKDFSIFLLRILPCVFLTILATNAATQNDRKINLMDRIFLELNCHQINQPMTVKLAVKINLNFSQHSPRIPTIIWHQEGFISAGANRMLHMNFMEFVDMYACFNFANNYFIIYIHIQCICVYSVYICVYGGEWTVSIPVFSKFCNKVLSFSAVTRYLQ